jgi:hypothetical protein
MNAGFRLVRSIAIAERTAYSCISQESRLMLLDPAGKDSTLAQRVESRVRESTHGRIRNLEVEEVQGRVVVRGHVPSHHTKQLALQGALELLSGDRFAAFITVG